MKRIIAFLLFVPGVCFADELTRKGSSVGTNEIELVWNVLSNHWPSRVWIYKVIPQNFAPSVISNLMAVGSFTKADRGKPYKRPTFKDDGLLIFRNKEDTRHLVISPFLGWIDYKDESAKVKVKEYPQGIPSEEEAYQMAVNYLRVFGVDTSQLATKGDSTRLRILKEAGHHGWFDKAKGTNVYEVSTRGIFFIRRVDGIDFNGIGPRGGVYLSFGNHGKIVALEIVWKGLEPWELHNTLSSAQMLDAIRNGKTKWVSPLPSRTGIKKITVTEVIPLYRGPGGDDELKFIEPYAILATLVDYGNTNVPVSIECPILGTIARIAPIAIEPK